MTQSINKHTDEEFKKLAQEHNTLYSAYKERGTIIKELEGRVVELNDTLNQMLKEIHEVVLKHIKGGA